MWGDGTIRLPLLCASAPPSPPHKPHTARPHTFHLPAASPVPAVPTWLLDSVLLSPAPPPGEAPSGMVVLSPGGRGQAPARWGVGQPEPVSPGQVPRHRSSAPRGPRAPAPAAPHHSCSSVWVLGPMWRMPRTPSPTCHPPVFCKEPWVGYLLRMGPRGRQLLHPN